MVDSGFDKDDSDLLDFGDSEDSDSDSEDRKNNNKNIVKPIEKNIVLPSETQDKPTIVGEYPDLSSVIKLDSKGIYWRHCTYLGCKEKKPFETETQAIASCRGHFNKHRVKEPEEEIVDEDDEYDEQPILKGPEADERDRRDRLVLALDNAPFPKNKDKIIDYILNEWDNDRELRNNSNYFTTFLNTVQGITPILADRIEKRTFHPQQDFNQPYPYGHAIPRMPFVSSQQVPYPPQQQPYGYPQPQQPQYYDAYGNPVYLPPFQQQQQQSNNKGITQADLERIRREDREKWEKDLLIKEQTKIAEKNEKDMEEMKRKIEDMIKNPPNKDNKPNAEVAELKAQMKSMEEKLNDKKFDMFRTEIKSQLDKIEKSNRDDSDKKWEKRFALLKDEVKDKSSGLDKTSDDVKLHMKTIDRKADMGIELVKEGMQTVRQMINTANDKEPRGKGKSIIDPEDLDDATINEEYVI